MASQDARLTKLKFDFKQQQSEMTNKIDTFLTAINDRMARALPSDTVKNPKLNVNSIFLVLSARSYLMEDPQCSYHIYNSINAIKMCSRQTYDFQNDQSKVKTLMVNEIGTLKSKEPEQTLEDKFKDFHLNLPVLEVLTQALMYNDILDKYVKSLELALGCNLEKIHVTWAHFEKKRTRSQLYTKVDEENTYSAWRRRQKYWRRRQDKKATVSRYLRRRQNVQRMVVNRDPKFISFVKVLCSIFNVSYANGGFYSCVKYGNAGTLNSTTEMALCLYCTFNGSKWHVECHFVSTKLPKNFVVGWLPLTKALAEPKANAIDIG
ncbi:hypothetical protein Tco_1183444 [Tanacetum coccineum]